MGLFYPDIEVYCYCGSSVNWVLRIYACIAICCLLVVCYSLLELST